MDKNLKGKFLFILGVILVCVLGLTWGASLGSFPHNITEVRQNLRNRIRLGLDLRGGTHLILLVHVEDAVNITTDLTMERLKDQLKLKNVPYADIQKTDSTHILMKGLPQEKSPDIQEVVTQQFSDWNLAHVPGDLLAWSLALKPSSAAQIPKPGCRAIQGDHQQPN